MEFPETQSFSSWEEGENSGILIQRSNKVDVLDYLLCIHMSMYYDKKLCNDNNVYSKTSNSGLSEKRTTSVQRTNLTPPIDFPIELVHFEPPSSGTSELRTPNNGH